DSGALEQVTDQNGNTLTYTDGGIASSTGVSVSFGRDAAGRITSVTDPNGATVQYTYDANGDLVAVTDRTSVTTRFEYNAARPHFLNRITDPLGRSGTRVEYDQDGRVSRTIDPEGNVIQFINNLADSRETIVDVRGNSTTVEYDDRGNILTRIDA